MRGGPGLAMAAALLLGGATPDPADWAFPGRGTPARVEGATVSLPDSHLRFTPAQLHDLSRAVDWWPDRHPPAPATVLGGRSPEGKACGFCHLPTGAGRPENASLAGLAVRYIVRQTADMKSGARGLTHPGWIPTETMHEVARAAAASDVAQAAAYFSKLGFTPHTRVVEAADIPAIIPSSFLYRRVGGTGREPLGARIVETPDDFERFEARDPDVTYTAYVPLGAVARGEGLARGGGGRTQPCRTCHGAALGGAVGPPLAGRAPTYAFRQLHAFREGARHGAAGAPMRAVVARLSDADMIDLAAYLAALRR